jgi:DUF1680 family protein
MPKTARTIFSLQALFLLSLLAACQERGTPTIKTDGREVVPFRALAFDLKDVKLLDGPFKHALELNRASLLRYQPDRLLSKFFSEAGLKPKAEPYGGWERDTIAGHSLGHYLSACAIMYRATGDKQFLERVDYIVGQLKICQDADPDGYVGAIPSGKRILMDEVAKGNIRSKGFDLNGLWVPFYVHHKVLAGLRDAYRLCGNKTALEIALKLAGWIEGVVKGLTPDQIQTMLACEHGGINEVLADLYADTGDERWLRLSRTFQHKAILDPLAAGVDILPGKHGNTNIPKLIGLARRYELSGDATDRKAAEFFWDRVVHHHSYVTGGHGDNEYFGEPDKLRDRLDESTTETCNVYNMLKLSEHLFSWEASADVADFYERALFNHILSSQHPGDGRVVYNLSLEMGGFKAYQDPEWFTCCIGTGMENHSKYGGAIFYHNNEELFVSQFIAAELTWREKGMVITQKTAYPDEQGTTLEFRCDKPVALTLNIRYPRWAEKGMEILVNGESRRVDPPAGRFVAVRGTWKTGDRVEVKLPFTLRLESMPDDPDRAAVMYGPLVLAGDLGPEQDPAARDAMYVPVFMTADRSPADWTEPVAGSPNTFRTKGVGRPRDVVLKPFYATHDRRYSIYWDLFSEEGWQSRQAEYRAEVERKKALEAATIDFIQPGEMQPERDHEFQGEKTNPDRFKDRPSREARDGWFSYRIKVNPDLPCALVVEYWGGFPGKKTFDILINGRVIASENISNKKEGSFLDVRYEIPRELTNGKSSLTVKFEAQPGNMAGPVFGIRTIRSAQ